VESLQRAALQLNQRGLLAEIRGDAANLAPDRTGGLKILLRQ
jgi:hypothetical protein